MSLVGPGNRQWNEVNTSGKPTSVRRLSGSGVLETTGVLALNTNSSGDWDFTMRGNKLDASTGVSKYYVDGQLIAVRIVPHGTPGGTPFRLTPVKGGKTHKATLYLHGVFEEHPHLRPAGRCRVAVTREVDANGAPYLLINMQSQLALHATSRDSDESTTPEDKTAAGDQKRTTKKSPPPQEPIAAEDGSDA